MHFPQFLLVLSLMLSCTSAGYHRIKITPVREFSLSEIANNLLVVFFNYLHLEAEAHLSTPDLIEYNDFPVEQHTVVTEDGYVLSVFRISGKNRYDTSGPSSEPQSPVILFPEVEFHSEVFLFNTRNESLGFILADAGFDVWLVNWRGTEYSRLHATLDPFREEYWRYSLDEMGKYDVADTVKYVHGVTGKKVITMAEGYGGLSVLIGLVAKPEINDMINLNVGLSPVATLNATFSNSKFLKYGLGVTDLVDFLESAGYMNLGFRDPSGMRLISGLIAKKLVGNVSANVKMSGNFNMSRLPIYVTHMPNEGSYFIIKHIVQGVRTHEVRQFDWGREENLRRHGTPEPQLYNFKTISSKYLHVRTFKNSGKENVDSDELRELMPDHHDLYTIPDKNWNHMSYMFSVGGRAAVYDYVIDYIRKLEKGESIRNEL